MSSVLNPSDPTTAERLAPWTELALRATQCGRLLRSRLAADAAGSGLSESEFLLLWACREPASGAGKAQSELAAALGLSPAQISSLVERLQGKQLLVGQRDAVDRRRQRWQATPRGAATLEHVLQRLAAWLDAAERGSSRQEIAALADGLRRIEAAAEAWIVAPLRVISLDAERTEVAR